VTGHGWAGEGAGGGDIVAEAVRAIGRAWSLRGPATALTEAFVQRLGARDAGDLLEGLTMDWYRLDADAAPLIFQFAERGDEVARRIVRWAGESLGDLAVGVIRQLQFEPLEFEVVLVGGLFNGGPLLLDPLFATVRAVAPHAQFVRLSAPPVVGGVLLGMQQAGLPTQGRREALIESSQALISRNA
jgi:N-acetylglucosamine kinase-like BadF-type ATPase